VSWPAPRGLVLGLSLCAAVQLAGAADDAIVVGSKAFNESYVLGEIMAQLLEARGFEVERRLGLGGTLIAYRALAEGEIDVYVEYTGTIERSILETSQDIGPQSLRERLAARGLAMLEPLGFDNTYALAVPERLAREKGLESISDLRGRDDLRLAFSHEFLEREDGWRGLSRAYRLDQDPAGIEHGLAYQAIASGRIDVTDAYATDGELARYDLKVLRDDTGFFPDYRAVPLVRRDFPPAAARVLELLAGRIDAATMRALNAAVVVEGRSFGAVARGFLQQARLSGTASGGRDAQRAGSGDGDGEAFRADFAATLAGHTARHLQLTGVALGLACLLGLPLGVAAHASPTASRAALYVTGLAQTIPSIALLALMIPLLGIGVRPAIVALFVYALLPIVRNTITALQSIDPVLRRVAAGIGLTPRQQVRYLLLPLAMPSVLAGVRTAAVISIGTATLAAFVGAGGLGQPIVTGLALNDPARILEGAIPAACLALLTELAFEGLERWLVPAHMRGGQ